MARVIFKLIDSNDAIVKNTSTFLIFLFRQIRYAGAEAKRLIVYLMNALSVRTLKQISWPTIVMFTLGFWLSGSLILDTVIIPSLLAAGMMAESGFASAGYLLFSIFNHIELVCGALVLTGCLIFTYN